MDWGQYFTNLNRPQKPSKSFAEALFEGSGWFLNQRKNQSETVSSNLNSMKKPNSEDLSVEKKEILNAIKEYVHQEKQSEVSSVQKIVITLNEAGDNPYKEQKGSVILHSLDSAFTKWNEYFERNPNPIHYFRSGKLETNLSASALLIHKTIVFVGDTYCEESSEHEDLLGKMIAAMNLEEKDFSRFFYSEDFGDENYLDAVLTEINFLKPQFVVTLGAKSSSLLLKRREKLSKIHGKFYPVKVMDAGETTHSFEVIPIFHPDFLRIKTSMKRTTWIDLQKIMKKLNI